MGITPTSPETFFNDRFKDKVLLVTGAAEGSIGSCAAIRAAKEGAKVVCIDIKEKEVNATAGMIQKSGGASVAIVADVSNPEDAEKMVNEAVSKFGRLDLVLNAAGVMDGMDPSQPPDFDNQIEMFPAPVHAATDKYWMKVFDTNIHGMFYSMRAEIRQMLKQAQGGAIVNIGSFAAHIGLPGNCAYAASKHAVIGLTRNAAMDYAAHDIRINSVNMAQTDTPMVLRLQEFLKWMQQHGKGPGMTAGKSQSLLQMADPNHRGATPWEQAAVILFLLSDDASNLTGANFSTDGGWTTY